MHSPGSMSIGMQGKECATGVTGDVNNDEMTTDLGHTPCSTMSFSTQPLIYLIIIIILFLNFISQPISRC